jgi:hypothetical protein
MSWFDTGGIATLAKTALKDMQKHIDKGELVIIISVDVTEESFLSSSS